MAALVFEMKYLKRWVELNRLESGGPGGSISHHAPDGRQVFVFECRGDHSIIERSKGGADMLQAGGRERKIRSFGFEEVARLTGDDEPCEFWVRTERMPEPILVRFRHEP